MTLDTFADAFDILADAPGGIPRLRKLILQLAVQGRLVEQDPNEGSGADVLLNIRQQSTNLGITKQSVKPREPSPVHEQDFPYTIPDSWIWVQLAEVGHEWGQKKPDSIFTYIDVSAIDKERGVISENVTITLPADAPSRARKLVRENTIIYSTVRPYLLNVAIVVPSP